MKNYALAWLLVVSWSIGVFSICRYLHQLIAGLIEAKREARRRAAACPCTRGEYTLMETHAMFNGGYMTRCRQCGRLVIHGRLPEVHKAYPPT